MAALTETTESLSKRNMDERAESAIIRLGSGETGALEELYLLTSEKVFAFALSLMRSVPDAEDAMHDTFLSIIRGAPDYRPEGKPLAWVLTIARNHCLMRLRERKKRLALPDSKEEWDALLPQATGLDPEDRLVLMASLNTLTEEENSIVVLHAVAGFKHREIAKLMGMPIPTVTSKYRRALKKLRKYLEGGDME